jgi:hypothetical protein
MTLEELQTLKIGDAVVANCSRSYGITKGCIYRVVENLKYTIMNDNYQKDLMLIFHRDNNIPVYKFFDIMR